METITWADFEKCGTPGWYHYQRRGHSSRTIVEDFPEARKPAFKLKVDFGEEIGIKKSSAPIRGLYSKNDLIGRQVIAVVNFPPKQIGPTSSERLVTVFIERMGR